MMDVLVRMDLSSLLDSVASALGVITPRASEPLRLGIADASKPASIAALAREATGATLIVLNKASRAQDLVEELAHWLGPDGAGRVRLYPQRDILPYERVAD